MTNKPKRTKKTTAPKRPIVEENVGAQMFFSQIVDLFNKGVTDFEIDFKTKAGDSGKLKVSIERVGSNE